MNKLTPVDYVYVCLHSITAGSVNYSYITCYVGLRCTGFLLWFGVVFGYFIF